MVRDQVSSRKPVATAIWDWYTTCHNTTPTIKVQRDLPAGTAPRLAAKIPMEPKQHHVDDRPDHDVEQPVRAAPQYVPVSGRDRRRPGGG